MPGYRVVREPKSEDTRNGEKDKKKEANTARFQDANMFTTGGPNKDQDWHSAMFEGFFNTPLRMRIYSKTKVQKIVFRCFFLGKNLNLG